MEKLKINKKGQVSLSDGPQVILLVGLMFLVMATIAFVSEKYGDSILQDQPLTATCNTTTNGGTGSVTSGCGAAYNTTQNLQTEVSNNTSIAGIVLTISLVGMVLTVLIGIFMGFRGRRV